MHAGSESTARCIGVDDEDDKAAEAEEADVGGDDDAKDDDAEVGDAEFQSANVSQDLKPTTVGGDVAVEGDSS